MSMLVVCCGSSLHYMWVTTGNVLSLSPFSAPRLWRQFFPLPGVPVTYARDDVEPVCNMMGMLGRRDRMSHPSIIGGFVLGQVLKSWHLLHSHADKGRDHQTVSLAWCDFFLRLFFEKEGGVLVLPQLGR